MTFRRLAASLCVLCIPVGDAAGQDLDATFGQQGVARAPSVSTGGYGPQVAVNAGGGIRLVSRVEFDSECDGGAETIELDANGVEVARHQTSTPVVTSDAIALRRGLMVAGAFANCSRTPIGDYGATVIGRDGSAGRTFQFESRGAYNYGTGVLADLPGAGTALVGTVRDYRLGYSLAATRLAADGAVVKSYGAGGTALSPPSKDWISGAAGAVAVGRTVVAAATLTRLDSQGREPSVQPILGRFAPGGRFDSSFGQRGFARLPVRRPPAVASGVAALPGGGLALLASVIAPSDAERGRMMLATFDRRGRLSDALVSARRALRAWPRAVAAQRDGKIVVAGSSEAARGEGYSSRQFTLWRFRRNLLPDRSFGNGGRLQLELGGDRESYASDIAADRTGRLVIAGTAYTGNGRSLVAVRVSP